ncbi:hypothetical protein GCM10027442_37700 [Emticicia fontis]
MQETNQLYTEKEFKDNKAGATPSDGLSKLGVLPSFTDALGKNILFPKIEVSGFTNFDAGEDFYGNLKLFTSAMASKQASNLNLFFPEASNYGISMNFNYLPLKARNYTDAEGNTKEAKWLCVYANLNYLGKNLYGVKKKDAGENDTTRFISDFAHLNLGIQLIPIRNVLSFYTDVNIIQGLTNRAPLKEFNPDLVGKFTHFWNFGTKFFLAKGEENPLKIMVDFSFIFVNKYVKKLYNTEDAILPKISIGGMINF